MTDLAFCWPGKTSAAYARAGIDDYVARIRHYRDCRVVITPEEPRGPWSRPFYAKPSFAGTEENAARIKYGCTFRSTIPYRGEGEP